MPNIAWMIALGVLIVFLVACLPQNDNVEPSPGSTLAPGVSPVASLPTSTISPGLVPTPVPVVPGSSDMLPIFSKPFLGDYPLVNFFDHNLPKEFNDNNGYLITWWGERTSGLDGHDGLDFLMPAGTQILAAGDGVVVRSGVADPFYCPPLRRTVTDSLGVEISHKLPDGTFYMTAYFHLSRALVEVNQTVRSGQPIGLSGNSGCSMQPHLHFTVDRYPSKNGKRVHIDPFGWSGRSQDPWAAHKDGEKSVWLWKEGKAPLIFRQESDLPSRTSNAKVKISTLQWMGWKDSENPNNEFVQFEAASEIDISGYMLKNLKGVVFRLPEGSVVKSGVPFRIYTGAGRNAGNVLYMNQPGGVWDNSSDCAILQSSGGDVVHAVGYGGAKCPSS